MIVSMPDTRVVAVLPGKPACGRRAAWTAASAHDMPALGVRERRARFASIHRTAKQTDAERKFALYIAYPSGFGLYFLQTSGVVEARAGLGSVQWCGSCTDAPRRLPTERRGVFFFCVKAFLLRQSFSFASKEGVYEHHSQENLAEL
jgi:hypothetical protein